MLWRSTTARDAAVVGALAPHAAELYALYSSSEGKPVSWRYSEVRTLLEARGLLRTMRISLLSDVTADTATEVRVEFGAPPLVGAWLATRLNELPPGVRAPPPPLPDDAAVAKTESDGEEDGPVGLLLPEEDGGPLSYDEWVELLVRAADGRYSPLTYACAHGQYGPRARLVPSAAQRASIFIAQLLGKGDEADASSVRVAPLPTRRPATRLARRGGCCYPRGDGARVGRSARSSGGMGGAVAAILRRRRRPASLAELGS